MNNLTDIFSYNHRLEQLNLLVNNTNEIKTKLENVETRLTKIEESQKRLETHNSFVTRVYFYMKDTLVNVKEVMTDAYSRKTIKENQTI